MALSLLNSKRCQAQARKQEINMKVIELRLNLRKY